MAKTISANRGPITLNSSTSTYNPLSILSGVTVSAPASIAVYGDNSQAWTITNAGTISSPTSYGIELAAGGTIKLLVDTVSQFGSKVGLDTYTGPKLENFATFDVIDLKNLVFGTATIDGYTTAMGLLQLHSGATKATLLFDNATLGSGSFHLGPDTGTGTVLTRS